LGADDPLMKTEKMGRLAIKQSDADRLLQMTNQE